MVRITDLSSAEVLHRMASAQRASAQRASAQRGAHANTRSWQQASTCSSGPEQHQHDADEARRAQAAHYEEEDRRAKQNHQQQQRTEGGAAGYQYSRSFDSQQQPGYHHWRPNPFASDAHRGFAFHPAEGYFSEMPRQHSRGGRAHRAPHRHNQTAHEAMRSDAARRAEAIHRAQYGHRGHTAPPRHPAPPQHSVPPRRFGCRGSQHPGAAFARAGPNRRSWHN